MATLINQNQQDEDKDKSGSGAQAAPEQGQQGPIDVSGGAGGSAVGTGSNTGGSQTPTASPKASSSGQFVNLGRYLQANQGAGQQIGKSLTGNIGKQTNQFGANIDADAQGVQSQLDAEKQRLSQASGFQQQVGQDASQLANDPTKLAQWNQMYAGQTAAPALQNQAQQNFDTEQSALNNIQGMSNLTGSEAGRFQLLRQSLGRPTYSRGQQNLDQLLLQSEGKGGVLGQFQKDINQNVQGAQDKFTNNQQNLTQGIGDVNTLGSQAQQSLQGALGTLANGGSGAFGAVNSAIQSKLGQTQGQADADYQGLISRLNNKQLTTQDLSYLNRSLGTPLNQETQIIGATPADIAKSYSEAQYGLGNVMTPQQLQQYKALQTLSGKPQSEMISGLDESQVGKDLAASIGVDANKLSSVTGNMKDFSSLVDPYQEILAQSTIRNQNATDFANKLSGQLASLNNPNAVGTGGGNAIGIINEALNNPNIANRPDIQAKLQSYLTQAQDYQNATQADYSGENGPVPYKRVADENGGMSYFKQGPGGGGEDSGPTWEALNPFAKSQQDMLNDFGVNTTKSYLDQAQGIKDAMYKDKGGMNVQDLLSDQAKKEFAAANPSRLQQIQSDPTKVLDNAKYQEMIDKYLHFATPGQATAQRNALNDLIGRGAIGASTLGASELLPILGKNLGGTGGDIARNIGNNLTGAGQAIGNFFSGWSDENLKTNVESGSGDVRNFLDHLKPYSYDYKNPAHGKGKHTSVMAQDLEKSPEGAAAIEEHPEGKAVNYAKLAGMMLASQADLHQRLKKMESKKKNV